MFGKYEIKALLCASIVVVGTTLAVCVFDSVPTAFLIGAATGIGFEIAKNN